MAPKPRTGETPKKSRKPPKGRALVGFSRLTVHPDRMGGMPCIRDHRFTAAQVLRLFSAGHSEDEILAAYPFLERADVRQALAYASGLVEQRREPIPVA